MEEEKKQMHPPLDGEETREPETHTSEADASESPTRAKREDYLLIIPPAEVADSILRSEDETAKWDYLAGEARRRHILTGMVSGVEHLTGRNWVVVVDFYGIRVMIPLREMVLVEWPKGSDPVWSVLSRIRQMLGATVDFIPVGVDMEHHAMVGSRKEAMLVRQKQYYGSGRIYPGMRIKSRVIGVSENGVLLEAAGVDSSVRSRNISREWFSSATDLYGVGEEVAARVMDVKYDAVRDRYSVVLSIKDAQEKTGRKVLEKLVRGSTYLGTVTGVQDGNIYIRLQVGCNAATRLYRTQDMPERNDTVSFEVRRVDVENRMVFGVITRIIKRHTPLR